MLKLEARVESAWFKPERLTLPYDKLLSSYAFNFKLCHYYGKVWIQDPAAAVSDRPYPTTTGAAFHGRSVGGQPRAVRNADVAKMTRSTVGPSESCSPGGTSQFGCGGQMGIWIFLS